MAYQIKISIMDIEPVIWRRLRIPGDITFQQLHQIIQSAFGWLDYHLFNFEFNDVVVAIPDADYAPGERFGKDDELDARNTNISQLLDSRDRCVYEYDFGDSWCHEIIIEKRLKDTKKNSIPVCVGGKRYRPPEDVGGTGGYENFIQIISDKKHPERDEMLSWAEKDTKGRIYDPEYFNINEVNRRLQYALENDYETAVKLFTGSGLSGTVEWGWSDTYIDVKGKKYSFEWIADMMMRLGEGSKVTIKVEQNRRRY